MKRLATLSLFFLTLSAFAQWTPYGLGLIQKPNAESARAYLGVTNGSGGLSTNAFSSANASPTTLSISTNNTTHVYTFSVSVQTSLTNGYPWGSLYDAAGAAQNATNGYPWSALYQPTNNNLTLASAASPGNTKYFGTDSGGTVGYYTLTSGGVTGNPLTNQVYSTNVIGYYIADEFLRLDAAEPPLWFTGAGTFASVGVAEAGHFGIFDLSTSTSSSGATRIQPNANVSGVFFGTSVLGAEFLIKTPAAVSDNTQNYELEIGFGDNSLAATHLPVDGAMFLYSNNTNGGNWQAVCANNSTYTFSNSSVAVTADAWWNLKIEGDATGTNVLFYMSSDGGVTYTILGPVQSNIPNTVARITTMNVSIIKSVGTTSRTCRVDRVVFWNNQR